MKRLYVYIIMPPLFSFLEQKWVDILRLCVSFLDGSGFWSSRGGNVHDEAVSIVGADPLCTSAEKGQHLLDGSETATATLLHWRSETRDLSLSLCLWKKLLNHHFEIDIVMLWYVTDVVSWPEVERLFCQSVFESMPLTSLDEKGVLLNAPGLLGTLEPAHQQPATVIPWDNPLSYAKEQLHNLRTKGLLLHSLVQLHYWCSC